MRNLGSFSCPQGTEYRRNQLVIARTDRGLEVGEVLSEATEHVLKHMPQGSGRGQILRAMTDQDQREVYRIRTLHREEFQSCGRLIDQLQLPMQLVDVEHLFGGERIIFYYLAENRVDFRELVKKLAGQYRTRIEMRQIGVRDEARLLADYGDCGKPVCCNTHLTVMPPVSMKMAKLQRATLDPTKISGRCGRLKCCLRYEYDTYLEMQRELPPVGSFVVTRQGRMKVLSQEILAAELLVETEDNRRVVIGADQVLTVISPPARKKGGNKKSSLSQPAPYEHAPEEDLNRQENVPGQQDVFGQEEVVLPSDRPVPEAQGSQSQVSSAEGPAGTDLPSDVSAKTSGNGPRQPNSKRRRGRRRNRGQGSRGAPLESSAQDQDSAEITTNPEAPKKASSNNTNSTKTRSTKTGPQDKGSPDPGSADQP